MKHAFFVFAFVLLFSNCTASFPSDKETRLTIVIFGATGDLTARKLYPALFNLSKELEIDGDFQIVAIGRRGWSQEEFDCSVSIPLSTFSRNQPTDKEWNEFKSHLSYQKMDFVEESDYLPLAHFIQNRGGNVVYFLATESSYFKSIVECLYKNDLLQQSEGFARVIIEKPFGEDLDSALSLQDHLSQYLEEDQIYRMDHYLGKEGLFKLAKFRLEEAPYEEFLNKQYIANVQLTLSETIGIGTRANFYEKTGHLRDVVQNHAMQLFAFAMMDKPVNTDQKAILAEKAEVLWALQPLNKCDIIRGQYALGVVKDQPVVGYREEKGIPKNSSIETFVQARLFINNERWANVPFYIRSGKRLPEQLTQVKYNFKENPLNFEAITVVIQPDPRILITQNGLTKPFNVNLDPALERREGYENQLLAAIKGDKTGFVALDEALSSWQLFAPVLHQWNNDPEIIFYPAGSWAPEVAEQQLQQDGYEWKL